MIYVEVPSDFPDIFPPLEQETVTVTIHFKESESKPMIKPKKMTKKEKKMGEKFKMYMSGSHKF